jgi:Cu(I)/Ag(I) efflux system membrane fusion protein
MKKVSIIIALAILATIAISCKSSSKETSTESTTTQQKVTYTCSMHPDVVSDKPGACPKCGMDLIVKK